MFINRKELQKQMNAARCFMKVYVEQVLTAYVKEMVEETGIEYEPDNTTVSIGPYSNWLSVYIDDPRLYDFITTHENGAVSVTKLTAYLQKRVLFTYDNTEIIISVYLECDLPKDDLEMFEAMGKIHTDVTPATITKSVICEI